MLECDIVLEEITADDTKGLLRELICVAPKIGEWAASLAGKNIVCGARLLVGWEQEPICEQSCETFRNEAGSVWNIQGSSFIGKRRIEIEPPFTKHSLILMSI